MLRFCIVLLFVVLSEALKVSDFFPVCHTSDPNYDKCLENTLNDMRPFFRKGARELKIISLNPIVIPRVTTDEGKGPISVQSTFNNLTIAGTNNYKVTSVKSDLEKGEIRIEMEMPSLHITSMYEMNGRILILPVKGKGSSSSDYRMVRVGCTVQMKPVVRNSETYMNLEKFSVDIKVEDAAINMTGLFDGNKELSDAMHKLITTNWQVIYLEIKPIVEETMGSVLADVADKIFRNFSAKDLFPK